MRGRQMSSARSASLAEGVFARRREVLGVRADHLPDDPVHVDVRHRARAGDAAVAQHGDVVADTDQLFEPVRDVDDRDALRLEVGDDAKQDLDLRRAERRGRLVHDEDARVARHRLGDLDQLLLADHQVLDQSRADRRRSAGAPSARAVCRSCSA